MVEIILDPWIGQMGEEKPVAVYARHSQKADISTATATFEIWDADGTQVLAPTACDVDGTTTLAIEYQVTMKTGGTIEAAGEFRGIFRLSYGSVIRQCQVPMTVLARPA